MFYLRFTPDPAADLHRKTSYDTLEDWEAEEVDEAGLYHGRRVVQFGTEIAAEMGGLCGYLLDVDSLSEAIEMACAGSVSNFSYLPYGDIRSDSWAIFEGEEARVRAAFGDADMFIPTAILYVECKTEAME